MRLPASVNLTPRPDQSDPGDLVVEISIDTSAFEDAMRRMSEAASGLSRSLQRSFEVQPSETYRVEAQAHPSLPGRGLAQDVVIDGEIVHFDLSAGFFLLPDGPVDAQAFDLDPDRCWKCDAKPGADELDGACWTCWYDLTGKAKP